MFRRNVLGSVRPDLAVHPQLDAPVRDNFVLFQFIGIVILVMPCPTGQLNKAFYYVERLLSGADIFDLDVRYAVGFGVHFLNQ